MEYARCFLVSWSFVLWLLFSVYSPIFSMMSSGDGTHAQHQEITCMADQYSNECVQTGNFFFFSTYQQYKVSVDKFAKGVGKAVLQLCGDPLTGKMVFYRVPVNQLTQHFKQEFTDHHLFHFRDSKLYLATLQCVQLILPYIVSSGEIQLHCS